MKKCRILVLAGGGCCAALITHFLSMLPEGKQNLNGIDVIAGCSAGGLLASAYSIGQPFSYIDAVFQRRASECFTKRFNAKINPLACPTYRNDTIDKVMKDMMGGAKVGDIKKTYPNLTYIVPALNLTDDKYIVFENITGKYNHVKLRDISGYTSAASTYFAGRDFEGKCIVDSGIIEVMPLLTATLEVKKKFGIEFSDMNVLAIGCGKDSDGGKLTLEYYNDLGLVGIAKEMLIPYYTFGNELFSEYCGKNIGYNFFTYFNPIETNGKLDDVSQIPSLVKEADKYREEFLRVWNYWISL